MTRPDDPERRREDFDSDDESLIRKLRALPPEGDEPDWQKLEARIRAQVGDRAPSPWWRRWRWIVPIWALATTAAVALVVMRDKPRDPPVHRAVTVPMPQTREPATPRAEPANSMWLDGEALELDDIEGGTLDELDADARAALETDSDDESDGILPVTDLGWVDSLDDGALERAESWLTRKRS